MREAPRFDRQRVVKGLVVGTLGLAVLFGSPALSFVVKPKQAFNPLQDCTQVTVDTWECMVDGKVVTCNPWNPQDPRCPHVALQPQGGTGGVWATVAPGVQPPAPVLRGGEKAPVAPLPLKPPAVVR